MPFLDTYSSFLGFLGFCLACGAMAEAKGLKEKLEAQHQRIAELEQLVGAQSEQETQLE
ncbi:hypothetical protein V6x_44250 [Gimesia chilikensis]|uniref:Uncharacterized protein n=1 Tax=Gimesia chilikensis TaxID=2605989 RepID=A0A517WHH4_9PLAN|nr:hypothetical protein [Gimesia chilikensis]QDU04695.1 hypothetical protein V6x_44250 [Gimesia chilikensis]